MEKDLLLLKVESLERHLNTLTEKVRDLEGVIMGIQNSANTNSPYSGNAFRSPFGSPFKYQPTTPIIHSPTVVGQSPVQNNNSIEQKLDRLLELFNNNFSRLNFRLEALENERRE